MKSLILSAALLISLQSLAQEAPVPAETAAGLLPAAPAQANIKAVKIALFKNGFAFVQLQAPVSGAQTQLDGLPAASLGSFWLDLPPGLELAELRCGFREKSLPARADLAALAAANPGAQVCLRLANGAQMPLEVLGKLLAQPEIPADERPAGAPSLVLLETANGSSAFPREQVLGIQFLTPMKLPQEKRLVPAMQLSLKQAPAQETKVGVACLSRGLSWSPSYRIELLDGDKARLRAQACILNEMMDLDNVETELVTGFPNLKFADQTGPEAMAQSLDAFLQGPDGRHFSSGNRQWLQQQTMNVADFYNAGPGQAATAAASAIDADDLFFFPVPKISLKKGQRLVVPLFHGEVACKHIYTWTLPDLLEDNRRNRQQNEEKSDEAEIWHCARLCNTLGVPLTTAPAEFFRDGRLVGQDQCHFTAAGQDATIRINRALKVLGLKSEKEVSRVSDAQHIDGYSYSEVTMEGEIKIRNTEKNPISMEITKEFSGELVLSSLIGDDVKLAQGLKAVNPQHRLTWKLELQPGEEKSIKYSYKVLVR